MKLFVAGIVHEANIFSPIPTTLESFRWQWWDPADGGKPADVDALAYGFAVEEGQRRGYQVVQSLFCSAQPSGPVTLRDWNHLTGRVLRDLRNAGRVDAVFLFLHGAEVVTGIDDAEADFLRAVRQIVGDKTPVGVVLDLHTNMTREKLATNALFIGCKEYPHIDYGPRTGEMLDILEAAVEGRVRPVTRCLRINMTGVFPTTTESMKSFLDNVMSLEVEPVLSISPLHGFFGAQGDRLGASVLVIADHAVALAEDTARSVAEGFASAVREGSHRVRTIKETIAEAIAWQVAGEARPLLIADGADNPGGGAAGDSTFLLRALIDSQVRDAALGMIWDPMVVETVHAVGEGARVPVRIGGKTGPFSGTPIDAEVEVVRIRQDATQSLFGVGEQAQPLGRSARLRLAGDIDVVVNSARQQVFSPHCFTEHGIDVDAKCIVVVKSSQHFEKGFRGIPGKTVRCDSPGSVAADYSVLPYANLRRPIYPVDRDAPVIVETL